MADVLGMRSVNTLTYWVKTGVHSRRQAQRMHHDPRVQDEHIMGDDRVRHVRVAGELDGATRELGHPMTDESYGSWRRHGWAQRLGAMINQIAKA